jgi:mRNA interferase MazF
MAKSARLTVPQWGNSLAVRVRTGMVIGLPMTTASFNETNPCAVQFTGPKGVASYILGHQPKSCDWRARNAKPHPLRRAPEDSFARACEALNQIIEIGSERDREPTLRSGPVKCLGMSLGLPIFQVNPANRPSGGIRPESPQRRGF